MAIQLIKPITSHIGQEGSTALDRIRDVLKAVPAIFFCAGLLSAPASAESPATYAGLAQAEGPCATTDTLDQSMVDQLRELALKPGVTIDPSTFMKDPQVAEFVAEMTQQAQLRRQMDWSGLCRYRVENALQQAKGSPQVVFLGDSITENWLHADPAYFTDDFVDRGISGQTSSQILLRFYPDVVALRPQVVHIMAGTNDILHNTGLIGDDDIVNNISAMIDIAQANHIKVLLASILPISVRSWQPELKPALRLVRLNERLQALAAARGISFIDYYAVMRDADNGLSAELGNDGVHPNRAGYAVMEPMATRAIKRALR